MLDYNLVDFSLIWGPLSVFTLLMAGITLYKNKEIPLKEAKEIVLVAGILLIQSSYVYGTLICLNYLLDTSPVEEYPSRLLEKHISEGKTATYYFSVAPWGSRKDTMEVTVTRSLYESCQEGLPIVVYYRNGALGIPTIEVDRR